MCFKFQWPINNANLWLFGVCQEFRIGLLSSISQNDDTSYNLPGAWSPPFIKSWYTNVIANFSHPIAYKYSSCPRYNGGVLIHVQNFSMPDEVTYNIEENAKISHSLIMKSVESGSIRSGYEIAMRHRIVVSWHSRLYVTHNAYKINAEDTLFHVKNVHIGSYFAPGVVLYPANTTMPLT